MQVWRPLAWCSYGAERHGLVRSWRGIKKMHQKKCIKKNKSRSRKEGRKEGRREAGNGMKEGRNEGMKKDALSVNNSI